MNKPHPGKLDKSRRAEVRRGGFFARFYAKAMPALTGGLCFFADDASRQ
ncbi:hypothetical protein [Oscillibacter sp.]|nr:hypothetical protein [Oscillibacter sp.]